MVSIYSVLRSSVWGPQVHLRIGVSGSETLELTPQVSNSSRALAAWCFGS